MENEQPATTRVVLFNGITGNALVSHKGQLAVEYARDAGYAQSRVCKTTS